MPDLARLADVFEEACALVLLGDNDFTWSSWRDAPTAQAELEGMLATLRAGRLPSLLTMQVIFAPTGPLQELSLSSGWSQRLVTLADAFDAALAGAEASPLGGEDRQTGSNGADVLS